MKRTDRRTFLGQLLAAGAAGAAGLYLTGCDSFLNLEPKGSILEKNFYESPSDALAAVMAAYDPLQSRGIGQEDEWEMGDVMSDDATKGHEPEWSSAENFNMRTSNTGVLRRWNAPWPGIYRSNLGLEKIPGIDMDESLKQGLLGELYFLRGLYYFFLVKSFGGVPLVTETLERGQLLKPRASAEAIYDQITKDLTKAGETLPWTYPESEVGRATRGAAKSLLGKVHLYQQKWSAAATAFGEVVDAGVYDLLDDYNNVFKLEYENSIESVFEIQFTTEPGEWTEITEYQAPGGIPAEILSPARGYNQPRQELVDAYEEGDPRKDATILSEGVEFLGTVYRSDWSPTGYNARKYLVPMSATTGNAGQSPINFKLIRYSDVLLMYAEALNEAGRTGEAETHVNTVRSRVAMPSVRGLSQSAMREAIRHERRVELGLEAKRFFDLVRWGIAPDQLAHKGFREGVNEVLPIPQVAIDINPKLEQNPGYA